jgi:hypothetical protein
MNDNYSHIKIIPRVEDHSIASSDEITFTTPSVYSTSRLEMEQNMMLRHSGHMASPSLASTVRQADTNAIFKDGEAFPTTPPISTSTFTKLKLSTHKPKTRQAKPPVARTVIYDPVQSPTPSSHFQSVQQSPSPRDVPISQPRTPFYPVWSGENDLVATSEPLPWKERPVQVADAYLLAATEKRLATIPRPPPSQFSTVTNSSETFSQTEFSHEHPSKRELSLLDAKAWWISDYRIPAHKHIMDHLDGIAEATSQHLQTMEERRIRQQNHMLFAPLFANLEEYLHPAHRQIGQFGSWAPCPEWSVDSSSAGLRSFFGEDWGAPPPRVGRDPRYRNFDGGRRHFEETWTRLGRDRRI